MLHPNGAVFSEDIREVAAEVRRISVVDHEARQNQLRARLFMDEIREQGMERLHPELLNSNRRVMPVPSLQQWLADSSVITSLVPAVHHCGI